ncbi:YopX family protein [Streptococcus uberis]|uniref:YopX family protein n=1 Tax=Streptococcus uberis TaxID=1349 RepID=UPI0006203AAB|nr:YopX family protein [Streptococcus uberis]KKF59485.1 hypothetical protein AF58_01890 [Streptococcus uberis C6344]
MIPKFRFYDKHYGVWLNPECVWLDEKGNFRGIDGVNRFESFDDIILMQSTGLFDKNGVEIFEGDIVNSCGYDSDEGIIYKTTDFTGVIVYHKNSFCIQCGDFLGRWWVNDEEIEVIGNIHNNPDLLESVEE